MSLNSLLIAIRTTGLSEGLEYGHGVGVFSYGPFRVPLQSQREAGRIIDHKGLDQTIVGNGFDAQAAGRRPDSQWPGSEAS